METGRFWPGPEMVKFTLNFCYCAVDEQKAVFKWKRAVSGPSALLGPEMVKFASNFCYCALDQKRPFLNGNGSFLAHPPRGGGAKWSNWYRISAIVL